MDLIKHTLSLSLLISVIMLPTYIINGSKWSLHIRFTFVYVCEFMYLNTRLKLCQGSFPEYLMHGCCSFFGSVFPPAALLFFYYNFFQILRVNLSLLHIPVCTRPRSRCDIGIPLFPPSIVLLILSPPPPHPQPIYDAHTHVLLLPSSPVSSHLITARF